MGEFQEARKIAFDNLSKHETVRILEKKRLDKKHKDYAELWEVSIEVRDESDSVLDLQIHVAFPNNFPLILPSILLTEESYERLKYIPHVDSNRVVCTYDSDVTNPDPNQPYLIVCYCIDRAKRVIEAGLKKQNLKDFEEEFLSYWNCRFQEPKVNEKILSLITEDPNTITVELFKLERTIGTFDYVLYQETEANKPFLNYLERTEKKFSRHNILYLEKFDVGNIPPFDLSVKSAVEKIKALGDVEYKEFSSLLNKSPGGLFVLFKKATSRVTHYLGFFFPPPIKALPGFRPNSITPIMAFTNTPQAGSKVERVLLNDYTDDRLEQRTSGQKTKDKFTFSVAGIGSVGSNLILFLNSLSFPSFRFIDHDWLSLENLNRHILGITYVGHYKAAGMRALLQHKNPKQDIQHYNEVINEAVNNTPDVINGSDYLFVAIGKINTENWISEQIKKGSIKVPTFIIWVEPYLAAGHCIFISPTDYKYDDFYEYIDNSQLFRWNIIDSQEYKNKNELLTLKEASCHTSYMPYSVANVTMFLSALFPHIVKVMKTKHKKSHAVTWVGDLNGIKSLGIELSEFGHTTSELQFIQHGI